MKKFWLIFLAITLSVLIFVVNGLCDTKKPELTVWMRKTFSPTVNDMLAQRAKEFAEKKNINLNFSIFATNDLYTKWQAAIESGQTPDVTCIQYQDVGEFYPKGLLMDLTALSKKLEKEQGAFYPNITKPIIYQGKQYAIPLWAESQVLIYRKDLLKAAGYSNPPKTWDEFRKIAKAINDPAKGIYGAGIGCGNGDLDAEGLLRAIITSFGGYEVNKDGKVTINSPQTIKAAKYFRDIFLIDKSTPPSSLSWDGSGNNKAYLSGQAAMIFNVGTFLATLKNDAPELYAKTGVAVTPSGSKGCFVLESTFNFGIFKRTKQPQLAQEFIEFCLNKNWYGKWIETAMPCLGPVYQSLGSDPAWQDPMNKPLVNQAKYYITIGYAKGSNKGEFRSHAGKVWNMHCYTDAFQRILVDKWAPKKAIKELQKRIEEIYKK